MIFDRIPQRIAIVAAAIIVAAVAIVYWAWNPADGGWFPSCMFRTVTGWECPGCGSQRALHALLHGDFAEAWRFNPYVIVAVPVACFLGWLELRRQAWPRLYAAVYRPATFIIILAITVAWTVYRNI